MEKWREYSRRMGASSYMLVVMGNLLVNWQAKYTIPSLVVMIIPKPTDRADAFSKFDHSPGRA